MPAVPSIDDVRAWTNVSPGSVSDDQLAQVIDAELTLQAASCCWDEQSGYPVALAQALLRRCARVLGARQLPLGLSGDSAGEWAPVRMPSYDVEVERLEAPYRVTATA